MAQGHGSNISFLCLPVQQSCSRGKIVAVVTSDCLTDCSIWAQKGSGASPDWLMLRYSWWLCLCLALPDQTSLICLTYQDLSLVCLQRKYCAIAWISFSSALCHNDSLRTRSIAAVGDTKQTFGKLGFLLTSLQRPKTHFYGIFFTCSHSLTGFWIIILISFWTEMRLLEAGASAVLIFIHVYDYLLLGVSFIFCVKTHFAVWNVL